MRFKGFEETVECFFSYAREASKANAIRQLKDMFSCDRVIAFGDGKNDIDMFEIADEGYAVSNAHEALKEKATGIIGKEK